MNILIRFKNMLVETLKDNWKLIAVLYILFIVVFVASWILSGDRMHTAFANLPISENASNMTDVSALDLFINNEFGGIVTYVSSLFFAIPAIVMLLYNAVNLGIMGQLFSTVAPNGGIMYIFYLIPHGIFEITATVLQSAAGILLFLFVWRFVKAIIGSETQGISESFEKTKGALVQSMILMIFATILLLIAAPIEAYFSVPFSDFIMCL